MAVMTVNGPMEARDLGVTLSHEHLLIDLSHQAAPGADAGRKVSRADLPSLMRNPYLMADNLRLDSVEDAVDEVAEFKRLGGRTIVDCTPPDIGRDPGKLRLISLLSGVNVVMGCGHYTRDTHPPELAARSWEEIRDEMLRDLREGVGGIRAGIIGEIGTGREVHPDELKVLKAAACASSASGAAIQVHTYPWARNGLQIVDFLLENGAAPDKIVICHADVALDEDYIQGLLEKGVFVQFDNFGKEFEPDVSTGGFAGGTFATDAERAGLTARLLKEGFGGQILMTTDVCLKCLLKKHGGGGYSHVLENVARLLRKAGVPEDAMRILLEENPARMLDIR